MMKLLTSINYLLVLMCILPLGFCCCGPARIQPEDDAVVYVRIDTVRETNVMNTLNYVGVIEDNSSVALSFSAIGTIEKIYVSEGQRVTKGQLVARLNQASVQNVYNAAESALKQAQDGYNRLKSIHDNGSLPEIQMVEMETKLRQAESTYNIAKKNLEDCSLYAPISGIAGRKMAEAGENAIIGKTIITIMDIDPVKVRFSVPENEISLIPLECRPVITVAALNDKRFTGKGVEKNVIANAVSHTYPAYITLPNPGEELLPGMVCRVEISLPDKSRSIVVPIEIIRSSAGGKKFVWCEEGGVAKRKFVLTGEAKGNGVEIKSGLTAGDHIVIEGYQKISEGDKISQK